MCALFMLGQIALPIVFDFALCAWVQAWDRNQAWLGFTSVLLDEPTRGTCFRVLGGLMGKLVKFNSGGGPVIEIKQVLLKFE